MDSFKYGHSQYFHLSYPLIPKLKQSLSYLFAVFNIEGYKTESEKGRDISIFALKSANVAQKFAGAKNLCERRKKPSPKTSDGIARYRVPENEIRNASNFPIPLFGMR